MVGITIFIICGAAVAAVFIVSKITIPVLCFVLNENNLHHFQQPVSFLLFILVNFFTLQEE